MDTKALSESIGIDEETYLMILNLFYERTMEDMAAIEAGVEEGKSDAAARGAHSIKGAAANLGIEEISAVAKIIELKARENMLSDISPLMVELREKVLVVKDVLP